MLPPLWKTCNDLWTSQRIFHVTTPQQSFATYALIILALCTTISATHDTHCSQAPSLTRDLYVGKTRDDDIICIGKQIIRYRLLDIKPATAYEVRVSYSAIRPAFIRLTLETPAVLSVLHGSRRLLDAEKIILHTPAQVYNTAVLLSADRFVRHAHDDPGAPTLLTYDIILEESCFGVPRSSFPIILTACFVTLAILAFAPIWSVKAVPRVLRWMRDTRRDNSQEGKTV